jgi:hypothetical protein
MSKLQIIVLYTYKEQTSGETAKDRQTHTALFKILSTWYHKKGDINSTYPSLLLGARLHILHIDTELRQGRHTFAAHTHVQRTAVAVVVEEQQVFPGVVVGEDDTAGTGHSSALHHI